MTWPDRGTDALPSLLVLRHLSTGEKRHAKLIERLAPHFIREIYASFRPGEISAALASAQLDLSRSRFHELYADILRAVAQRRARPWLPGTFFGGRATAWPWPKEVSTMLQSSPTNYSVAASEVKRRLDFFLDPASVCRFALHENLAPSRHLSCPALLALPEARRILIDAIA